MSAERLSVLASLLLFSVSCTPSSTEIVDLTGIWKLNVEESSWGSNARRPLHVVVRIEHQEPQLKYSGTVTYADEETRTFLFDGAIDGKEYESMRSYGKGRTTVHRIDGRTASSVFTSLDGSLQETANTQVSMDGRVMTRRMKLTSPQGEHQWTEIYERQ